MLTSAGDQGFVVINGKVHTFLIKDNTPETPIPLEKTGTQVNSIHVIGNSKLLYIADNTLSCAEFKKDNIVNRFNFKIRGEDILRNSVIEYIQLNPADPGIGAPSAGPNIEP